MACQQENPVLAVMSALGAALHDAFTGVSCPPKVGNVEAIRFFAGDAAPLGAWDSHRSQGCDTPFVWVREMRRYRSAEFPAPTVDTNPCECELIKVVAAEVGVGWCAEVEQEPTWAQYAQEFAVSTDTAWRVERALCRAATSLKRDAEGRQVGTDTLSPYGPEGGVIAWTGVLYASY